MVDFKGKHKSSPHIKYKYTHTCASNASMSGFMTSVLGSLDMGTLAMFYMFIFVQVNRILSFMQFHVKIVVRFLQLIQFNQSNLGMNGKKQEKSCAKLRLS